MESLRRSALLQKETFLITKCIWITLIAIFTALALYQIFNQFHLYITTPVATNIEADYPSKIAFPTVAICNNNQFRLTYLTGARIQNRRPKNRTHSFNDVEENSTNVFDKALLNSWDMDALKFLRNAAHWKSRMILKCTWPNGTSCRMSDFKAVWTLTGLCWAINSDPLNPMFVSGSGSGHSLRLLLNVERYERVESCTPKFRTTSLPGLKILIYNQTDVPITSLNGVNVPPGYTMDIPFYMKQRHKFPGFNCIQESKEHLNEFPLDFDSPWNTQTCLIRNYLSEIERQCACSMRRAYDPNPKAEIPFCSVDDYFSCVLPVLKWGYDGGFSTYNCMAACDEIDYVAWQDMNELPNNIFPKLIDSLEDEDETDVETNDSDDLDEEVYEDLTKDEHYKCEHNQILEDAQVSRIKREAHRAYEKQARYQEDILLRTKKLITKMKQSAHKLNDLQWGWHSSNFKSVYKRLKDNIDCYGNISVDHQDVFNAISNPAAHGEERRSKQLVHLLSKNGPDENLEELKTISDVKHAYGADRVEQMATQLQDIDEILDKLHKIYIEETYQSKLSKDLEKVDRILQMIDQFDGGKLQKRVWAEKMQSRNMRHFFDEDFYEDWYNVIAKDLDQNLVRAISDLEDQIMFLSNLTANGTGLGMGSVLLFGESDPKHVTIFATFLDDIIKCTMGPVKENGEIWLKEFKKVMHDFQSSYTNLYKKELPEYLDNFEFGNKFVKENFAIVNVFLHKMNIEHWRQDATYSFWSMLCDVGGALGLFLGASLLTLIELIYLCCQYGCCKRSWYKFKGNPCKEETSKSKPKEKNKKNKHENGIRSEVIDEPPEYAEYSLEPAKELVKKHTTRVKISTKKRWNSIRDAKRRISQRYGLRPKKDFDEHTSDEDESGIEYETMLPLNDEEDDNVNNEKQEKMRKKKKGQYGKNLPKILPGILKSSFRKKPKDEKLVHPDSSTPFESSADDIDLTEVKPDDEPEKPAHEKLKTRFSLPKQVVIPIESDDNIEQVPLKKEPRSQDMTRPLTPEIVVVPKENIEEPEKQQIDKKSGRGPEKSGTQTPDFEKVDDSTPKKRPIFLPESPPSKIHPEETSTQENDTSEPQLQPGETPSSPLPRTKSSKTPSISSPITDSQYSTDSLQAFSEPEMGFQDESEPEHGDEPRQALLAAIDSLLKDDLPEHMSKPKTEKAPEEEKRLMEPVAEETSVSSTEPEPKLAEKGEKMHEKSPKTQKHQSPVLSDSGISPRLTDELTPSTSTLPSETTPAPKLADSGIADSQKMEPEKKPEEKEVKPEIQQKQEKSPEIFKNDEPYQVRKNPFFVQPHPEKSLTQGPTHSSTQPTQSEQPLSQEVPPQIDQSSRETSAAPTDPREHRSKSQSSSLYPPSDPRQDSEPEFVSDPGPSQRSPRMSPSPDLPTPLVQSQTEAYPIEKITGEQPESLVQVHLVKIDDTTSSSSSSGNVPKLVFGHEKTSPEQDEPKRKGKKEERQTIV